MPPIPTFVSRIESSSGLTALHYYRYTATEGFRGNVQAGANFDLVDVALVGYDLRTDHHAAPVQRAAVNVQMFRYDAPSGEVEVGVNPQLHTDGQGWTADVCFVVIATSSSVAHFTPIGGSGAGSGTAVIARRAFNAIPAGMEYVGLATQIWDLGSDAGAVPVNTLAAHHDGLTIAKPNCSVDYVGTFRDGHSTNQMFFEWQAVLLAFNPNEMTRVTTTLPNQYTWIGGGVTRQAFASHAPSPPAGKPVTGFLDTDEGTVLQFGPAFGGPSGPEHPIWMIESSAQPPILGPASAITEYGTFIGTTFGDATKTDL